MLQTTHKGLSGTALKTIALVLMLMDHIHYFFEFTGCIPEWFSMLARLSAPLFLFCTVEGFAHTHDRKRYFFRIWCIGAGMAAVQFFMIYAKAFRRGDGFYPQNAMFPQLMQRPIVSAVLAFVITSPVPMWTSITDGGWGYLVSGVLLYLLRNHRKAQVAVWALNGFLWDFVLVYLQLRGQPGFELSQMFTTYYEWFGVAAAVLMLAYNGMRGSGHKQLFYWFYPAHVYLLYGVSCLVYRLIA